MGHDLKDIQHEYRSRLRQLHTPFYGETMALARFLHILHIWHFADNTQKPEHDEDYDQLWKLRTIFDTLYLTYAKFYNPSKNLAVDKEL
jgi:hypothetical protein